MSKLPYLPVEIKEKIISMVDDIDIRRYFGVYSKLDKSRYKILNKLFPIEIFYRWKIDKPEGFNPVINPINTGIREIPLVYNVYLDGKWQDYEYKKAIGNYNTYEIRYNLQNHLDGKYREDNGWGKDIMDINIIVYDNVVIYDIGIYKIKKKTGNRAIEDKNIYYIGKMDKNLYYADYIDYRYVRE